MRGFSICRFSEPGDHPQQFLSDREPWLRACSAQDRPLELGKKGISAGIWGSWCSSGPAQLPPVSPGGCFCAWHHLRAALPCTCSSANPNRAGEQGDRGQEERGQP